MSRLSDAQLLRALRPKFLTPELLAAAYFANLFELGTLVDFACELAIDESKPRKQFEPLGLTLPGGFQDKRVELQLEGETIIARNVKVRDVVVAIWAAQKINEKSSVRLASVESDLHDEFAEIGGYHSDWDFPTINVPKREISSRVLKGQEAFCFGEYFRLFFNDSTADALARGVHKLHGGQGLTSNDIRQFGNLAIFVRSLETMSGIALNTAVVGELPAEISRGVPCIVFSLTPQFKSATQINLIVRKGRIVDATNPFGGHFQDWYPDRIEQLAQDEIVPPEFDAQEREIWAMCVNIVMRGVIKCRRPRWPTFSRISTINGTTRFDNGGRRVIPSPGEGQFKVVKRWPGWSETWIQMQREHRIRLDKLKR